MRRTLIVLSGTLTALVASLALLGATADASSPNLTWGTPTEVAGALNVGGGASVNSVSCSSVGSCTAGGSYQDASGHSQAFVVDEVGGTWGTPIEIAGALNVDGIANVDSVSCSSVGNCAAGGFYEDASSRPQAFIDDEVGGVWGTAIEIAGGLNVGIDANVASISCSSAGNCAAGGQYEDGSSEVQAFVVDEVGGVWGTPTEIAGALNVGGDAQVFSVSCWSDGNCAVGGRYETTPASGREQLGAFVDDELGGVWGTPTEVAGSLNTYGFAGVNSVSCAANGNCAAGGYYTDSSGFQQGFVVKGETGGVTWGTAAEVAGALNAGSARVNSVSCSSVGNCVAGGFYEDSSNDNQAFLVNEVTGVWGAAAEVTLTGNVGSFFTGVNSVSCAAGGGCVAAGSYADGSGPQAFLVEDVGGVLGPIAEAAGALGVADADASAVSCAPDGSCAAGGSYGDTSGASQAFLVNSQPKPTVAVTSSSSAVSGGTLVFGATVSGPTGEPTPTGTVIWTITSPGGDPATCSSTTVLGGSSNAATAACSVSAVVAGQYTANAAYGGDANYTGGASTGSTATVAKATTATNLVSSLSPATFGQSVSFTAKVTGSEPSGTVTFSNGSTLLGTATLNASGQAVYATTSLALGEQTITAAYGGDANNTASVASPLNETVNAATRAARPVIVSVGGRSVQVSFGATAVAPTTLHCAHAPCSGTVTLTKVEVMTVERGKRSVRERRTFVLGRTAYHLEAGKTATAQTRISNASAAKLSASRTMTVRRTITVTHGRTVAATVVLKAPRTYGGKVAKTKPY